MTKEKWSKRDRSILDGIRREDITAAVQMIRSIDAIEWKRSEPNGKTTKDGEEICSMPYPNYPEGVFEILSLTGIDSEYDINYKKYCENVSIKDMGPAQIQTMLTWIQRGEHFCVGFLAERIENGELLALLCRLDEILIGDLLNKAISFAVEKHSGQFRKGTDIPYIVHPLEVMTILTAMRADPEVVTAGVLHDTVEDTDATIEQIESLFGARVAELVASHSEDKSKSWKERKEYAIEELRDATYDLKCLIMADKLSNMRAIARDFRDYGEDLWKRFNASKEKQSWYYSRNIDALEGMQDHRYTAEAYWELNALYKEVFVRCYYDEPGRTIWQKALGDEPYYITADNLQWRPWEKAVPEDVLEIPVKMAERIEDNWIEASARIQERSPQRMDSNTNNLLANTPGKQTEGQIDQEGTFSCRFTIYSDKEGRLVGSM